MQFFPYEYLRHMYIYLFNSVVYIRINILRIYHICVYVYLSIYLYIITYIYDAKSKSLNENDNNKTCQHIRIHHINFFPFIILIYYCFADTYLGTYQITTMELSTETVVKKLS